MLTIETKIFIRNKTRREIIRFLSQLNSESYRSWHAEHVDFEWLKKERKLLGSRLFIAERIDGRSIRNIWRVVRVENNSIITFEAERILSVLFEVELHKQDGGTLIYQRISLGFDSLWGKLVNPLILFIYNHTLRKSYQRHILEEYKKLEEIC